MSNKTTDCGQNCIHYPIFDKTNNVTHFPVNLFSKTSFQGFNIHQILVGCQPTAGITNSKFLVTGTFIDLNFFLHTAHSVANKNVWVELM